jgi:hypothetical protein
MSTKLVSPSPDLLSLQSAEEEQIVENLQQEIECPRCSVMTLSSDFDKLLYFCQECQLSLVTKYKNMNRKDNRPKPKKHHSNDESNSGNYLPTTIAKLEAYSRQNKRSLSEKDEFSQKR